MIRLEEMIKFDNFKPGKKVELLLLYFPEVREYKLHGDPSTADGPFVFYDKQNKANHYYADRWIELEFEEEIPF